MALLRLAMLVLGFVAIATGCDRSAQLPSTKEIRGSEIKGTAAQGAATQGAPRSQTAANTVPAEPIESNDLESVKKTARTLEAAFQFKQCEQAYTRAIVLAHTDSDLYRERGEVRKKRAKYDGALTDFNAAIKCGAKTAANYRARALYYLDTCALACALKDIDSALALEPKNFENYLLQGQVLLNQENGLPKAKDALSKAIGLNGSSAECYAIRAFTEWRLNEKNESNQDINKALALGVKGVQSNYFMSVCMSDRRKWQKSLSYASKALELQPTAWYAHYQLSVIYRNIWEEEKALASLNKAIELNPKNWQLFFARSYMMGSLDRPEQQLKDFNSAIALEPKNAVLYEGRADTRLKLHQLDGALKDCDLALANGGNKPRLWRIKGVVLADQGKLKDASLALTEAITLEPNYDTAYCSRAMVYTKLAEYDKAIADYTYCLKRNPGDLRSLSGRALAYEKSGKPELAKRDRAGAGKDYGDLLLGIQDATSNLRSIVEKTEGVAEAKQQTMRRHEH